MFFMSGKKGDCNPISGQSVLIANMEEMKFVCLENLVEGVLETTLKISHNPLGRNDVIIGEEGIFPLDTATCLSTIIKHYEIAFLQQFK